MQQTIDQLELDLAPIMPIPVGLSQDIDTAFESFNRNNPHVYRSLRALALQARQEYFRQNGVRITRTAYVEAALRAMNARIFGKEVSNEEN